jgi:ubiquinone/menaquinone biosynthesis C-methylase UbiE
MPITVGNTNVTNREDWLAHTLQKIPAGSKLLDAGAGECQFKKFCTHLDYLSQDFAQYSGEGETGLQMGKWDNSKLDIVSDIADIPLPDGAVDAIMCTEVFEHLPNPVLALKEFSRLIKPGGYLIITAPFASLTHFAPYHFATGFNKYYYEYHLPANGFEIVELDVNGTYFEFMAQETRRIKTVAKKYAGIELNFWQQKLLSLQLRLLQWLAQKDKGSSELLCFGMHILARKNNIC